jgi:hypothetical protein
VNPGKFLVCSKFVTHFTFHNFERFVFTKLCHLMRELTKSEASEKTRRNFGLMKDDISKEFGSSHDEEIKGMSKNMTPSCVRTAKCSRPRSVMKVTRVRVRKKACTVFCLKPI